MILICCIIVAAIGVFYVVWIAVGFFVLNPLIPTLIEMRNCKMTAARSAYELTFWPYILYQYLKYKKEF